MSRFLQGAPSGLLVFFWGAVFQGRRMGPSPMLTPGYDSLDLRSKTNNTAALSYKQSGPSVQRKRDDLRGVHAARIANAFEGPLVQTKTSASGRTSDPFPKNQKIFDPPSAGKQKTKTGKAEKELSGKF